MKHYFVHIRHFVFAFTLKSQHLRVGKKEAEKDKRLRDQSQVREKRGHYSRMERNTVEGSWVQAVGTVSW